MNFTASKCSYDKTGYFSKLVTDYLNGHDFLKSFYAHPVSLAGFDAAIRAREQFPTDRNTLVQVLEDFYRPLAVEERVNRNIRLLAEANTFTVTTAHQPAIFTGHLYFIYKILHVIRLAEMLKEQYPDKHFVPVYYMGSEDADLDELGHIFLDGETVSWDTQQTGAVGRMSTKGLDSIVERIEGEFATQPFGSELVSMLRAAYLESDTIQMATLKLLHRLFGRYGLLVLIADDKRMKAQMKSVFRDDLLNHLSYQITREANERMENRYPVQANPREINLFYLKDQLRNRLEQQGENYRVVDSQISFSKPELEAELEQFPERFSPNVILRGLFQETILPNIAFVGGGGELAYWLELKALFDHYHVPYPVLVLRNSFLLIRENWREKMNKAGLTVSNIFHAEDELLDQQVKEQSEHQLNLRKEIADGEAYYDHLKRLAGSVDETLAQHVESLRSKAMKSVVELEKKILRAEKRNFSDLKNRIHEVREALFPNNELQERIENFIPWYAAYGEGFIDLIYDHSLTMEQEFMVLTEIS
ncbi:MAG TPA: bacillithiol biosynthesis cysteine-adding enzyme BshC [Puia sp.]|nr:bacillithiol biosynthesis cysteine-adding enzyme BshC [Puia sp.]